MDYQVILTKSFTRDLAGIVKHLTKQADPEIATRAGNELIDHALDLARNPAVGQLVKKTARGAKDFALFVLHLL